MAQAPRELGDDKVEQKNWFQNFLESEAGRRTMERIDQMISQDSTRCILNFSDVREFSDVSKIGESSNDLNMAER